MSYTLLARGKKGLLTAVWYEPDPGKPGQLRQKWKSTGTAKKSEAEKQAALWSEAGRKRRVSEVFVARTVELQRDLLGAQATVTTRTFTTDWVASRARHIVQETRDFYNKQSALWLAWLQRRHLDETDIALLLPRHVTEYLDHRRDTVSAKTANHSRKFLLSIFKAAVKARLLIESPLKDTRPYTENVAITAADHGVRIEKRRPFTETELDAIFGVADPEWESMIMTGLHASQRLKDNALLIRRQIDLTGREIEFTPSKTARYGKVIRPAIGTPLYKYFQKRGLPDDPNAPLHPKAYAIVQRTGRTTQLSTQFGDLLAQAGLRPRIPRNPKKDQRKGLSARRNTNALSYHCLRHTHISLMKRAGAPESAAMDNSGHSSKEMSRIYTHTTNADRRKYADKLPNRKA